MKKASFLKRARGGSLMATAKPVRRRPRKEFTLAPKSVELLKKLSRRFDGNESRTIDAALQALSKEKVA